MKHNQGEAIDKPSELKIALDNRIFEIQMFWQRSNYFLVLMTALGVGVFTIKEQGVATLIALFAAVSSYYWYRTNLGSKFWQESWEVEVVNLAKIENVEAFTRSTRDIIAQVSTSLQGGGSPGTKRGVLQQYIDKQIIRKPSVSYYMTLLSLSSILLWSSVSVIYGVEWLESQHLGKIIDTFCATRLPQAPDGPSNSAKP